MEEEKKGNPLRQALSVAMKKKSAPKNEGGKCYACGGMVGMNQGGGVDEEYNPESINDVDGDDDDLVYSPETSENEDTGGKSDAAFLKAYMVSRRLRGK